jgi:hypothetical protein
VHQPLRLVDILCFGSAARLRIYTCFIAHTYHSHPFIVRHSATYKRDLLLGTFDSIGKCPFSSLPPSPAPTPLFSRLGALSLVCYSTFRPENADSCSTCPVHRQRPASMMISRHHVQPSHATRPHHATQIFCRTELHSSSQCSHIFGSS